MKILDKIKDLFSQVKNNCNNDTCISEPEILFLKYCDGKKADTSKFAKSFYYNYNLDYQKTVEKLFKYGYLTYAEIDITLNTYKIDELKCFLKSNSLSVSGTKTDLIKRITANCSQQDITQHFTDNVYAATDIGKSLIYKIDSERSERRKCLLLNLFSAVKERDYDRAFDLVRTKDGDSSNPLALPYDKKSIMQDIDTIHYMLSLEKRTSDDDFASATYSIMLHQSLKNVDELNELGYKVTKSMVHRDFITLSTLKNLEQFKSVGVKKFAIASAKDCGVCSKCREMHGKVFDVKKAQIGVNAPPFCDDCRCIIMARFDEPELNLPLRPVDWDEIDKRAAERLNKKRK